MINLIGRFTDRRDPHKFGRKALLGAQKQRHLIPVVIDKGFTVNGDELSGILPAQGGVQPPEGLGLTVDGRSGFERRFLQRDGFGEAQILGRASLLPGISSTRAAPE